MKQEMRVSANSPQLPTMVGHLSHQNQVLKVIVTALCLIAALSLFALFVFGFKDPGIVALSCDAQPLTKMELKLKDEMSAMAEKYLSYRFNWNPGNIKAQFGFARNFVSQSSLKAFDQMSSEQSQFASDKKVVSRLHVLEVKADEGSKTIRVIADRITEVQGLKAATLYKAEFGIEVGSRTSQNPWGLYVLKESEVIQ